MAVKNYKRVDIKGLKPGYKNTLFIAAKSWFTTLAVPDPLATDEDTLVITDDHIFAAGKGFLEVTCIRKSNTSDGESKGDQGAGWMEYKLAATFPGDNKRLQYLIENIMNEDLIILQKDTNCNENTVVQWGCDCDPAAMGPVKQAGGTIGGDKAKNWSIEASSTCRTFYEGTISMYP